MKLKEKIKKEIDNIPEEYLPQLERYLEIIKRAKKKRGNIKTVSLKGRYDDLNVRKLAYE